MTVVHAPRKGVWPSWVMQSWLSPVQSPAPSSTAKAAGLPSVQSLHRARMLVSLVGSKFEMIGLILRPLIPPCELMSPTKNLIAFTCSLNSTSLAKPSWDERLARFATGNATVIVFAVTPRVLVLAWSTGVPPAAGAPETSATKRAVGVAARLPRPLEPDPLALLGASTR